MSVAEGRSRTRKAERKQVKQKEMLTALSWQKRARCVLCRRRFVVNNYPDHKVRVNKHKIAGKIICPWCTARDGKFVIQLMLVAEKLAAKPHFCPPTGKCSELGCIAKRILQTHENLPSVR